MMSLVVAHRRKALELVSHRGPAGADSLRIELAGVSISMPARPGRKPVRAGTKQRYAPQRRDMWRQGESLLPRDRLIVWAEPFAPRWSVTASRDRPYPALCPDCWREGSRPEIGRLVRNRLADSAPIEPAGSHSLYWRLPGSAPRNWTPLYLDHSMALPMELLAPCWDATDFAVHMYRERQTRPGVCLRSSRERGPDSGIESGGDWCHLPEREGTRWETHLTIANRPGPEAMRSTADNSRWTMRTATRACPRWWSHREHRQRRSSLNWATPASRGAGPGTSMRQSHSQLGMPWHGLHRRAPSWPAPCRPAPGLPIGRPGESKPELRPDASRLRLPRQS